MSSTTPMTLGERHAQRQEKRFESRIRRLAKRNGYFVRKSRAWNIHADDLGEYMLVDAHCNTVVRGERFDASLEEIEEFLAS